MRQETPIESYPELAKAIGLVGDSGLFFKREDLHPYGSHKGRSIPVIIDLYAGEGAKDFVITGSGNAAYAAALKIQELEDKTLDIFVGNHIDTHKLEKLESLESDTIRILKKERPLQALMMAVDDGVQSLRQSTDDNALLGYKSLAQELAAQKGIGAVFMGTSSGTTAQALADYFLKNKLPIQMHIVQTSACHPIADGIETYDGPEEESIAGAIVDRTAMRKAKLVPLIQKTGGNAWVATNEEIRNAVDLVEKSTGVQISTNSALSVVGVMQAIYRGWEIKGSVVCMICGD